MASARPLTDRLETATGAAASLPRLAQAVCAVVAEDVRYVFGCFATTDPTTGLVNWAHKSHPLEVGDEEFAAAEYGPPDINTFAELATRPLPFGVLSLDTDGEPKRSRRFRTFLAPRFGFTDELRVVFRTREAVWGALAVYRGPGEQAFSAEDGHRLAAVSALVAGAIQRTLFLADPSRVPSTDGPAVLLVDGEGRVLHATPAARLEIEELGGWEVGSLPTSILVVAANARRATGHAGTRVLGRSGRWLALRAARLEEPNPAELVVVTVETAPSADLGRLALAARGLTSREQDVAALVLQGVATPGIAAALHLSPHTVQDHLKAIFGKAGVRSRRELVSRFVLG